MTKSIVTGAAGFVGSHLADRLLAMGHEVVGIDSFTDSYARHLKERNLSDAKGHERFQLIDGDLLDIDLDALLVSADHVFHLAGQPGVRPSWGSQFAVYVRNNIAVTQRLLEAAKRAQLRAFVFASSSSIYGDAKRLPVTEEALPQPVSPYGVTKLAAEQLCSLYHRVYRVPTVSLRYFTAFGPRQRPEMAIQRFLSASMNGERVTIFGDGTQTRDFTFVDDIVEANVRALEAPANERIFNVCGGSRVSVNDLIQLVGEITGKPLTVQYEPPAKGDALHTLGDNSLAQQHLGFSPKTSLANGVVAQWRWLKETGRSD